MGSQHCCRAKQKQIIKQIIKQQKTNIFEAIQPPPILEQVQDIKYIQYQNKAQTSRIDKKTYSFSSLPNNNQSLVMLKEVEIVVQSLMEHNLIVWIDSNMSQIQLIIKNILNRIKNVEFHKFQSVRQAKEKIEKQFKEKKLTIITSLTFALEVQSLISSLRNVDKIICFCMKIQIYEELKFTNQLGQKFDFGCNTQTHLVNYLEQRILVSREEKTLPNFIALKGDGWNSNIQLKCLTAMIRQNCNRSDLIGKFCELSCLIYPKSVQSIEQFRSESIEKELSIDRSIYWYTKESPIYKVLNNLLRSSNDPAEIFYCQPYFKDLFNSIKILFQAQTVSKNMSFKCFRGGLLNQKEIQQFTDNVGEVVQNLGFLSTSLDLQVAKKFAKNVLFQISVEQKKIYPQFEFGYADISFHSPFNEKQVIFNPLNNFKITNISDLMIENRKIKVIYLSYGQFSRIKQKKDKKQNPTPTETFYYHQSLHQKGQLSEIKTQGHAFVKGFRFPLSGSIQYWEKLLEKVQKLQERSQLLLIISGIHKSHENYQQGIAVLEENKKICEKLGKISLNYMRTINNISLLNQIRGNHEQALLGYQQCLEMTKILYGRNCGNFATILSNIGLVYVKIKKYKDSLQMFQQCRQIRSKLFGHRNLLYSQVLNNIGLAYANMKNFKEALKNYQQSLIIIQNLLGKNNPEYAGTLVNVGILYSRMKNYSSGLMSMKQGILIQQKILGKKHRNYTNTLSYIGHIYRQAGQLKDALTSYEELKIILQSSHRTQQNVYKEICQYINQIRNIEIRNK